MASAPPIIYCPAAATTRPNGQRYTDDPAFANNNMLVNVPINANHSVKSTALKNSQSPSTNLCPTKVVGTTITSTSDVKVEHRQSPILSSSADNPSQHPRPIGVLQNEDQWRPRQLARLQLLGNSVASARPPPPPDFGNDAMNGDRRVHHRTLAVILDPAGLDVENAIKPSRSMSSGNTGRNIRGVPDFPFRKTDVKNMKTPTSTSGATEEIEATERVKTKLLSVWNNVKYGWTVRMKTNFSRESPIWFLGQCYHHKMNDADNQSQPSTSYNMDGFKQDFISRIWFTYRREFPTLAGSAYSSDCGWGCMLRSGQMMLVQALVCHFLGRGWRWNSSSYQEEMIHRRIVRWFGDWPGRSSPFSIHRLVNFGEISGKRAGDWYGPASVAHIIRQSLEQSAQSDSILGDLCVYVAQDCTVYTEDVLKLCKGISSGGFEIGFRLRPRWKAVIILVPVRLGGETLNPIYFKCVQAILANEYCIGIIGGRPRHSLYFVGWQEDKLIHLDPHYCQEAVDVTTVDYPLQSFHCMSPRKLSFTRMDPSCTIGFYCHTENDLFKFLASCKEVLTPPRPQSDYPVFVVAEGSVGDQDGTKSYSSLDYDQSFSRRYSATSDEAPMASIASEDEDYEEFVFL